MKKTYSKPDIMFESFSLCTNVAAGCEFKTPLPQSGGCGVRYFNSIIFQNAEQGCNKGPENTPYDTVCYHQPLETNNLFTS